MLGDGMRKEEIPKLGAPKLWGMGDPRAVGLGMG